MLLPSLRQFVVLSWLGLLALATGQPAFALETGLHYYAVVDLTRGEVVQRGKAGDNGIAFDQLILGPRRPYRLLLLQASTFRVAEQSLTTPESGSTFKIGAFTLQTSRAPDTDRDGLPDDGELIMGTDPRKADTDGDGISDGAEVRDGGDPLSGLAVRTGIIASVRTPGPAADICTINNLAIVALRDRGVAVYNIFAGFDPVSITLVDTPGIASRVSCSGNLIGVADGVAGLAVIDISDPPAASVARQVPLGSPATSVATAGFLAFVGLESGEIALVDMNTGDILIRRWLGAPIVDVTFGRNLIYALTALDLHTLELVGPDLDILSSITSPASSTFPNRRLFVGGGHAIATRTDGYNVFSLAQPERPALLAVGSSPSRGWRQMVLNGSGEGVAAVGTTPSVGSAADISIYDVSDPSIIGPLITTLPTPGSASAVALFNGLAYCADYNSGIQVINYMPPDRSGNPPTIRLETSFPDFQAEEGKIFVASAQVTDDVQVRNVEFHLDGRLALTDGDFPFEYRFIAPSITPGRDTFSLRARAFDTGGNTTWSDEISIRLVPDATPPRITRVSPAEGSFVRDPGTVGIVFNEPMDQANLATNLTFRGAGPDGIFFNADDLLFPVLSLSFPADTSGAFLAFDSPLTSGRYRLDLAAAAADLAGNPLGTARNTSFIVYRIADDADGDCVPDALEPEFGFDPNNADTDGDGISDGDEDSDGDRLSNCAELLITGTTPNVADSDGDGVLDGDEDSDSDGITDGEELVPGNDFHVTNPLLADSDDDGNDDGVEVALGLDPNNPADAGQDVVIDARTVTLTGNARLGNLTLRNGAVLTHPAYASRGLVGLTLNVSNLVVDATSRIDVSGRGYPGGLTGYNSGSQSGRTRGDVAGSTRRNGGSHGGLGAVGDAETTVNEVYGDPFEPIDLGSGGGSDSGSPGSGGGRVRITAEMFQLDGRILANGSPGSRYGGGGSGGSIFVSARSASGTGSMEAGGGAAGGQAGGGGGGRVALVALTVSGPLTSQLSTGGGIGASQGGSGTVYVRIADQPSELVIRGPGRETTLPAGNPGGIVILDGSTVTATTLGAAELRLVNGAVLTHPRATPVSEFRLNLEVDSLVVEAGSRIDVSGRGYAGGQTQGLGWNGRTLGNQLGSSRRAGGSYGGLGSVGDISEPANLVYGDFRNPNELGSGGGSDVDPAGAGGGLVRLTARSITLEGEIRANGANGARYGGGGSGGGIWIQTTGIAGNGRLTANGGASGGQSGTGGGGRIAVRYSSTEGEALANIQALSGPSGWGIGGPGTVYLSAAGATPQLIVRGNGRETPLPPGNLGSRLIVDGGTVSATNLTATELQLANGAVLTHPPAGTATEFRLVLNVDSLLIDADSRIDVSGRGYAGGQTLGIGWNGRTLGNQPGSSRRAGGSYGGLGSVGDTREPANAIYGDFRNPNELGSGGGSDVDPAGAGGGLVRLAARSIVLEGEIRANGANGSRYGGGGSGGGIWIQTTGIVGSGRLSANGGASGGQSGTGGGGRIAVLYSSSEGQALANVQALSGSEGWGVGGPGTVYLSAQGATPQLVVRGTGRETPLPDGNLASRLLLDGGTVSATNLTATELQLVNGAVLTHPSAGAESEFRLILNVDSLLIDASSRIDVSGRGYAAGQTLGIGWNGRTLGNQPGSGRRAGGSYGGLGSVGDTSDPATSIYGDFRNPNELGSGGGSDDSAAGAGGGLVRLTAGSITLEGEIRANGGNGSRYGGGGSGGGIWIQTTAIVGSGRLNANGGSSGSQSGTGGGGRVAVLYSTTEGQALANVRALPGSEGWGIGGPGTVYLSATGGTPQLVVRGSGRETPLPEGILNLDLLLDAATVSAEKIGIRDLSLTNGAVLTHPASTPTRLARLEVTSTTVLIDDSSQIRITGRGFPAGLSPGNNLVTGITVGLAEGSGRRAGGSHGGLGGTGDAEGNVTPIYGDYMNPDQPGAGGGVDSGSAGAGGGALRLITQSITVLGGVIADGAPGSRYGGGGAGGSIWITADTISGSGQVSARGGSGGSQAGTGGGGRVAVHYGTREGSVLDSITAISSTAGHSRGAAGTIYLEGAGAPPELLVRGPGRESPLPAGLPNQHLTIDQATMSATRLDFADLRVLQGAVLTHPPATRTNVDRLAITANRVEIDATSRIDLTGRGYRGGQSLPLMGERGHTLNHAEGSFQRTGGSYGGLGGIGDLNRPANETYGAWNHPNEAGSGGGADSDAAGSGGGLATVTAGELVLDGLILSHGAEGSRYGGGGSGGGIRLEIGTLRGSGTARANGGGAGGQAGSGGGGRIAIVATNLTAFDVARVEARGGLVGLRQGSPGTVYLGHPNRPLGDLRVDARGTNQTTQPTRLWMSSGRDSTTTTLLANRLTDPLADFIPGGLVGLELNPDTNQSSPARTFTIVANDATTITTDPADGDMRTVAANGRPYAARFAVTRFSLLGGAIAEFVDADQNLPDRQGILAAGICEILGSSVLTHPVSSLTNIHGLYIRLTDQLVLDATSRIDVSARGYRGAHSGGNSADTGRTLGNAAGSTRRVGGSHGGTGGLGDVGGTPAPIHGDPDAPVTQGGGGGSDSGPAGDGGGRVFISTLRALLNGSILADGGSGSRYGGGGAGGGIQIVTDDWAGAGIIRAKGGNGAGQSGGGGGGRIALQYRRQTLPVGTLSTPGGTGVNPGEEGSVSRQVLP